MSLCPCGNATASGPICFYCEAGVSEAATLEIRAAKRLIAANDFAHPNTGETQPFTFFTLCRDTTGRFYCVAGLRLSAESVASFERSAAGRWLRREVTTGKDLRK